MVNVRFGSMAAIKGGSPTRRLKKNVAFACGRREREGVSLVHSASIGL